MENTCRKAERHAMGIAPSLLCSEGQTTAQQWWRASSSAAVAPASPSLSVDTANLPMAPTLPSCMKFKGQSSCSIRLSPSFNGKLVPSPHKLSKMYQESKECVLWQSFVTELNCQLHMKKKHECQGAREKQTDSKKIWKSNANKI